MGQRRPPIRILFAAAAALALWIVWHPPVLQHPDSDLYEHLSVARHLVAGDGVLNDLAYPLSYAFPFAARIPQPLVHRPPGYALWLTPAAALSGGDPAVAVTLARWLTLAALGGLIVLGLDELRRRRRLGAAPLWLPLLLMSPLLDMTVRWCQVEVVTALLLTAVWRRAHGGKHGGSRRHGAVTGLICGLVALMRFELVWLPWLWLAVRRKSAPRRWWIAAAVACAVTLAPWLVRNAVVTGNPVFTLQAYAEHLKDTPGHPGMSAYLELAPESFRETLQSDAGPILRKARAGLIYQAARADNWIPWPLALAALAALVVMRNVPGRAARIRPLALLAFSWGALVLLYAPLSHDLRYMMVLLPVALLELAATVHGGLSATRLGGARPWSIGLIAALGCLLILWLTPLRMPGWEQSRNDADALWLDAGAALARTQVLPPGPIVTDHGAVFWMSGRAGVVRPADRDVWDRMKVLVPEMSAAHDVRGAAENSGRVN